MTYKKAKELADGLKARYNEPYGESDKLLIAQLYREVLGKTFTPTTCQSCYHDAVVEIYCYLKQNKAMKKKCNYRLCAGFIISCPDFYGGKIFTNDNLTDKVAKEYLSRYPAREDYFQILPEEDLIENKE